MKKLVVAALLLVTIDVIAQPRFADRERGKKLATAFPEIERLFAKWVADRHMPGAAFGIVIDGELAFVKTHGVRALFGEAVTPDTPFRIASMTKSFTAMAIVKLRDEGKLSLDDPAAKYVPELSALAYPTKDSPQITIRHLLTHSEGFPEDNPWGDRQLAQPNAVMSEWMKGGIPFSTTPGTAYEYSNYGFAILGQIIERVAGKSYDAYVREQILLPLGMGGSTFDIPANGARGYRWQDGRWVEEPILPHGSFGAMGGLWTSTRELARYVAFLLAAFPPRDDADRGPIRRAGAREMQQMWRQSAAHARREMIDAPLTLTASGYGYGLRVERDCRFAHVVGHGGGLPGYGSLMTWLPEHGVGLISMSNVTYGAWRPFFNEVFDALRRTGGLQPRVLPPSPALLAAQADVTKLILQWDDALASRIAADNLFLDEPAARRAREFRDAVRTHGNCTAQPIEPENLLRGRWKLACDRGSMKVTITLAPTNPPRVQYLDVESVMPPSDAVTTALTRALADPPPALRAWGRCTPGEALAGNGTTDATIRVTCEKGIVSARVSMDGEGKLKTIAYRPSPENVCVP